MHTYYCLLGNTPQLSHIELASVVKNATLTKIQESIIAVDLPSDADAEALLDKLGGTIKIIRHIEVFSKPDDQEIIEAAIKVLTKESSKTKIVYGISEIGRDHLPVFDGIKIKSHLQNLGYSAQYKSGPRAGLPTALLLHKAYVQEIVLIGSNTGTFLGKTIAVQDIDEWTNVDRNKPYSDRKKGMLPPKVARMMVNWALADVPEDGNPVLYDPFCGSGTILLEAMALGKTKLIGSDLDPDAVTGTRQNIEWYSREKDIVVDAKVHVGEVSKVTPTTEVDLIVTEPYLGKPRPNPAKVPYIIKGLEKLYKGAFKHWATLLADGAQIVIVMPTIEVESKSGKKTVYSLEKFIDSLRNLGYTTTSDPVEYYRSQAIVKRSIYKLQYNKEA